MNLPQQLKIDPADLQDTLLPIKDESGEVVFSVSYPESRAIPTLRKMIECYNRDSVKES